MTAAAAKIVELDKRLSSMFSDFAVLAQELEFQTICDLTDEPTIERQRYPGIYRIDIEAGSRHASFADWIREFKLKWEHDDYIKKFTPNTKKKRIERHSELMVWIPLYLGKSRNIAGRVWEHLHLKLEQPTTALKLNARTNLAGYAFQLSTVRLEVENYDLIMPSVEKALRDKFNPILGRQ